MSQLALLGLLLGIVVAILLVDQLFLWMERRGWMYWRRRKRPESGGGGGMAGVLTSFQQFVEPEIRHAIEAKEQQHAEIDEHARRTRDDKAQPPIPDEPSDEPSSSSHR